MEQIKHPLFLIIDGMSQAYRAHFAIRDLSNSQGLPTNAIYGFAIMLKRVLQKYPPEYVAIALDGPAAPKNQEQEREPAGSMASARPVAVNRW